MIQEQIQIEIKKCKFLYAVVKKIQEAATL